MWSMATKSSGDVTSTRRSALVMIAVLFVFVMIAVLFVS